MRQQNPFRYEKCFSFATFKQLLETINNAEIMQKQHHRVDIPKYLAQQMVQECIKQRNVQLGRRVQSILLRSGFNSFETVADSLIRLFVSGGCLCEADEAFRKVSRPSSYAWGAIISAHAKFGHGKDALHLYEKMQQKGIRPDRVTFLNTLKACGSVGDIEQGRRIHGQIVQCGLLSDIALGSSIVNMYAKCRCLKEARKLFESLQNRDVVTWGAMIGGYAQHGEGLLALECFEKMQLDGLKPDRCAFLSILKACANICALDEGRNIHKQIVETGLQSDIILGSSLVDMYAKCGSLEEACVVFGNLPHRDVVLWGAMIAGYAQHNEGILALECFEDMLSEGIKPNKIVFSSTLKACASIGAIEKGRQIHQQLSRSGLQTDLVLGNSLVDMYAKCGSLGEAGMVFDKLANRDMVSWGAMIAGYAQIGEVELAMRILQGMQGCGIKPDDVAFCAVLSALNYTGLVDEGLLHFNAMRKFHDIKPSLFHTTCMVDLLGHAGYFKEANDMLKNTEDTSICLWRTLLSASRIHGNIEVGRQCFDKMVHLDSQCVAAYIMMSNIYATACMKDHVYEVEMLRKHAGACLEKTCIEEIGRCAISSTI